MKYKFAPQVLEIIDAIAALPDTPVDMTAATLDQPQRLISGFEKWLRERKNDKQFAGKEWAKLRRQLSFLYESVLIAMQAKPKRPSNVKPEHNAVMNRTEFVLETQQSEADDGVMYREIVKFIKNVHSGQALQTIAGVQMGMKYGVVHLSDHEIQGLIDRNKV